jgi:hypothetical protein
MKVAFVSTMAGLAWGGSEELWSRTAMRLCGLGHEVQCSVLKWDQQHPAIDNLAACGARMHYRPRRKSLMRRMAERNVLRSKRLAGRLFVDAADALSEADARADVRTRGDVCGVRDSAA